MKWLQLDNEFATATGKQHCYIHKVCKIPILEDEYDGNISLCERAQVIDEDETRIPYVNLDYETLDESKACKICLKKFKEQLLKELE